MMKDTISITTIVNPLSVFTGHWLTFLLNLNVPIFSERTLESSGPPLEKSGCGP